MFTLKLNNFFFLHLAVSFYWKLKKKSAVAFQRGSVGKDWNLLANLIRRLYNLKFMKFYTDSNQILNWSGFIISKLNIFQSKRKKK